MMQTPQESEEQRTARLAEEARAEADRRAAETAAQQRAARDAAERERLVEREMLMREHNLSEEQAEARMREEDERLSREERAARRRERLMRAMQLAGGALGTARNLARRGRAAAGSAVRQGGEAVSDIAGAGAAAGRRGAELYNRAVAPGSGWYWLFLLITLALHFLFFLPTASQAERTGPFILYYLVIMLFVFGVFWFFRRGDQDDVRGALIATFVWLILYLMPGLFSRFVPSQDLVKAMSFIVAFIPIWPVFMASRIEETTQSKAFHLLFNLYKLSIVLVVLFFAASALLDFGGPRFSQVDWGSPVDIMQGFWDFTRLFWDKIVAVITGTAEQVDRITNPSAYYTGQIEESEKIPLGVEITRMRPADKYATNETVIIAYGDVHARPMKGDLFQAESVTVIPGCNIERKDVPEGAADPPKLEILWGAYGQFQCEFAPLGKKGTYAIVGTATFPFETWAYITYTFVDEERARNIAIAGKDIRQELGVRDTPIATYTSGPIMLGMGGAPQPVIVKEGKLTDGTRLGITLDNNWAEGELFRVKELQLKVPEPFTLTDCDREISSTGSEEEGYATYTFDNDLVDKVTTFTSVTCKLNLNDKAYADQLLVADVAERTFIGRAAYEYTVEEKTTVQVR